MDNNCKKVKLSPTSAPSHHRTLAWRRVFSGFYLLFIVFDDVLKNSIIFMGTLAWRFSQVSTYYLLFLMMF
jgi:hypothetical protein